MGEAWVLVIALVIVYFAGKAYARKLYQSTGYYAYGKLNHFFMMIAGLFAYAAVFSYEDTSTLLIFTGLMLIPLAVLVIRNLKLKNPVHIIVMSIIQVLAGAIAVFGFFAMFILKVNVGDLNNSVQEYQKGYKKGQGHSAIPPAESIMTPSERDGYIQGSKDSQT